MIDDRPWLFFYPDLQCQIHFGFRIGRFLSFDVRNPHDWTVRIAANIFARWNVRLRRSAAWLNRGRSRDSDLQATISQCVGCAIRRAELLDSTPDIVRAIEQLHR